jgi:hypothetical protein
MPKPKQTLQQRAARAEELGNRYLGDANEAAEAGDKARADRLFEKGQFWLDRFNLLTGRGERAPPRR